MSADLFAEFANFSQTSSTPDQRPGQTQQPQQQTNASQPWGSTTGANDPFNFGPSSSATNQTSQSQSWDRPHQQPTQQVDDWGDFGSFGEPQSRTMNQDDNDDDDGWGDFETADQPNVVKPSDPVPGPALASSKPAPAGLPGPRIARASTFDLMTNNLVDVHQTHSPLHSPVTQKPPTLAQSAITRSAHAKAAQAPAPAPPKPAYPKDPNVLFDAEDFDEYELEGGEDDEDDDEFGDFETGTGGEANGQNAASQPQPQIRPPEPQQTQPARPTAVTMPTMDLLSLDDAPAPPPQPKTSGSGLGSLHIPSVPAYPDAPKSPSYNERNPFPGLALKTPTSPTLKNEAYKDNSNSNNKSGGSTPDTAWPAFGQTGTQDRTKPKSQLQSNVDFGDDWEPFEDIPEPTQPKKNMQKKVPTKAPTKAAPKRTPVPAVAEIDDASWDWEAVESPAAAPSTTMPSILQTSDADDKAPPPTNIPPPSVLLSVFPEILSLASSALFKPLAGQTATLKERIMSDPETVNFLRAYLLLATVAARVIAGRKLRWHRDKFLSQSMAISAAGAKGMKLAGVDKAQAAHEDREAADVIAAWKEDIGRLRSAVATANSSAAGGDGLKGGNQLKVPELSETMPITTAKMVPTAPKACVICGLKRSERVGKVDFDVEDSFGEWWVEHWGHRACKNFWVEHEKKLRSR